MIAYTPTISQVPTAALADQPSQPKLSYKIGDDCWIHVGTIDERGNPAMMPGKVVFWFDLVDLAQRIYVVRLRDHEFIHLENRDATLMAPSPEIGMPFSKSRHDNKPRADNPQVQKDWRNS